MFNESFVIPFTVTVQEALRSVPSIVVAVIVAVPRVFAVTSPLSSTDATLGLEEDHLGTLIVALDGKHVAVSVIVPL